MKRIFLLAGLACILLGGAVFALPLLMNSSAMRMALAGQLSTLSGSDIRLDGPVRFAVLPDFGVVAEELAVTTADQSATLAVGRLVGSVRLRPLLSGQVSIAGITLESPRIELAQGEDADADGIAAQDGDNDIFRTAADLLERLNIDRLSIVDGTVTKDGRTVASDVDVTMKMPGIDSESSLEFSALANGRKVKVAASIDSLRRLLRREATAFSASTSMEPAPHPALASLTAKGNIALAGDGSYRIEAGEIASKGQPMRLDLAYMPGERPRLTASVKAERLDFTDFEFTGSGTGSGGGSGGPPDLGALRTIDATIDIDIGRLVVGQAEASDLSLSAQLEAGRLETRITAGRIAEGRIASTIIADVNAPQPVVQGSAQVNAVTLDALATLAGAKWPASGDLGANLQFAFQGMTEAAIRNTLNVVGDVSLENGRAIVPALADVAGKGADRITGLYVSTAIRRIEEPVDVKGRLRWNGENVEFAARLSPLAFLSKGAGPVDVSIDSGRLSGSYSGTVGDDGTAEGQLSVETQSLTRLLAWLGQDPGTPLGRFQFDGKVGAGDGRFAFSGATIALDGMEAKGAASFAAGKRSKIQADLAFGEMDLARFAGGGSAEAENAGGDTPVDLSFLRLFDADIKLSARRIGYGKVAAGPAKTTVTIRGGKATLEIPQTPFYGGVAEANLVADGSGKAAAVDLQLAMAGVDALPLFKDAASFSRVEGKLEAKLSTRGSGRTTRHLARSLAGEAQIRFSDGALRGIDVAKVVNNLQSILATGFQEGTDDRTVFTEMGASMTIEKGVARTQDLRLLGPLVRMSGSGEVDIADRSIDMRLTPKVVGSLSGQGGQFDLSGLALPFIVKGPLARPRIYPDLAEVLKDPKAALGAISRLGVNVEALGGGKLDALSKVTGVLGGDGREPGGIDKDKAVSAVIERLAGSQQGERVDTRDILGSVLKNVVGRGDPSTGAGVAAEPREPAGDPAGKADPGEARIYDGIPVPTPSPRKAEASRRKAREADKPKPVRQAVTEQIVEQIIPPDRKGATDNAARDLLNGILNSVGN